MSSSSVQLTAISEKYGPAVHQLGYRAPTTSLGDQNAATNGMTNEFDDEQSRLRAEVVRANERTEAARRQIAQHNADARVALRTELEATRERLADMERVHRRAVETVRDSGKREIERILAEAHEQAAVMRQRDEGAREPAGSDAE